MRLWHQKLIKFLPNAQLRGQHNECCALRGNGWGRKHSTVDYVFRHNPYDLYNYHVLVMNELRSRGVNIDPLWYNAFYRGKTAKHWCVLRVISFKHDKPIYVEHDNKYFEECILNLKQKGIYIILG